MERLTELVIERKIPVGDAAEWIFDWLTTHARAVFDLLATVLQSMIDAIMFALTEPHPFALIAVFMLLAYALQRRVLVSAGIGLGFLFILNQDYWDETMQSLTLVLASCVVCMGVGVPVGIGLAHRPRLYAWVRPLLDLMQTLPTFVYLIPAIVFFGIGMVPGLIATVIFVLPAPIRLTQLGISSTPAALREAGTAFGATGRQLLWKVEIPSALPQIMAGLNQTIMLSLSMVVIAALVGASGLGVPVVRALNSVNTSLGFESGLVIVVVAIMLDRLLRFRRKS
ncbi:choline ABC transporter permease subunit [Paracoccus aerodenitrificans]|uniref:choline ABC transporter permease subunit n=1 Tax=Paracoccus aerodenitrificans TaxID=3017781 RepID=UPI0022F0A91C|nr:choline ABC transporter permease subunit [Paracoccus aerodenitrificans]WBU64590.1 choline ABC transporter permease subunit [Paracoccus aerodenitrificans]